MEVAGAIPGEFLQNEHTGIPTRLLLVPLQQADGSRHFVVHKVLPKCYAADLSYLSESLRRSKHDVEVAIRQKGLDIIVEAEKILFEFDGLFSVHVEEMVWDGQALQVVS